MSQDYETLRWPTNLDRAGIEKRLTEVREAAEAAGLGELAALFAGIEKMSAAQIGSGVVAGLNLLQATPEHRDITMRLEMIAMNLKNLKAPG